MVGSFCGKERASDSLKNNERLSDDRANGRLYGGQVINLWYDSIFVFFNPYRVFTVKSVPRLDKALSPLPSEIQAARAESGLRPPALNAEIAYVFVKTHLTERGMLQ